MSKIVVAEDEIIIAVHLETLLKQRGYKVCDKVIHAEDVIKSVKQHDPDILILDIMLANTSNGIDAAQKIREFSSVPIIFLSALSDKSTSEEIRKINNSILINKPFDQDNLIQKIKALTIAQ